MQLADIIMKIKTLQTKIRHLNAKSEIRSNGIVMYNTKIRSYFYLFNSVIK